MTDSTDRVTMYADYICPFCYLGKVSLDQYRDSRPAPLAVDWHPFDLRSHQRDADGVLDETIDSGKDENYYDQVRANVERLKVEYGAAEMRSFDDVPDVDSFNAQLASLFVAEEHPTSWAAFDAAVYRALWVDGREIGDPAVLAELASDAGIPPAGVREAVTMDDLIGELQSQFAAAEAAGVTGVPTFRYGEHTARGAVPPSHLERMIDGMPHQ